MNHLKNETISKVINSTHTIKIGHVTALFTGAGFAYSIQKQNPYWHLPVIFIFPSIYAGYNLYKNKEAVVEFIEPLMK